MYQRRDISVPRTTSSLKNQQRANRFTKKSSAAADADWLTRRLNGAGSGESSETADAEPLTLTGPRLCTGLGAGESDDAPLSDEDDPAEPPAPRSALAHGIANTADPTPRATAKAPTRPIWPVKDDIAAPAEHPLARTFRARCRLWLFLKRKTVARLKFLSCRRESATWRPESCDPSARSAGPEYCLSRSPPRRDSPRPEVTPLTQAAQRRPPHPPRWRSAPATRRGGEPRVSGARSRNSSS